MCLGAFRHEAQSAQKPKDAFTYGRLATDTSFHVTPFMLAFFWLRC